MTIKKLTGDTHPWRIEGYERVIIRVSLVPHDDIVTDIRCLTHRDMARVCIIMVRDVISVLKSLQCCLSVSV